MAPIRGKGLKKVLTRRLRQVGRLRAARARPATDPRVRLGQLITGQRASQAVVLASELSLADRLAERAKTAAELADEVGASAHSLERLLRALADMGVLRRAGDARFALTAVGGLLRSDVRGSLRPTALMEGSPWMRAAWGELSHSVRTGEPAADHALGRSIYDYLRERPEQEHVFNDNMASVADGMTRPALLGAYDFSAIGTLIDVGGGRGVLLAGVLEAYPEMRGVVFDRPSVAERAREHIEAVGLADRCRVAGGDFLEAVPPGGDAYMISMVLNDWSDDNVRAILSSCRAAIPDHGRLLIVEMLNVTPGGPVLLDLQLMVVSPGRLRTEREWAGLLSDAGFRLARAIPTRSPQSVLEAIPA